MQKKHFYSHIIEIDSLFIELNNLELSESEKMHLTQLIESNIHHSIVDTVLSELTEEDKRIFLTHMHLGHHDKIWHLLKNRVEDIEEKIKTAAESLKEELHRDIKEIKEKKKSNHK